MRHLLRSVLACSIAAGAILASTSLHVAGQSTATAPKSPTKTWTQKTPWGDPDLQGIWSYATITPLERPGGAGGKEFLSDQEMAALNDAEITRNDTRGSNAAADVEQAYNAFWWDRGKSTGRTSLIIDPPD